MKQILLWVGCSVSLLLVLGGFAIYITPIGTGEYRSSPNFQYCARATTYDQRRLFAPNHRYLVYQVTLGSCEQPQSKVIWQAEYEPVGDEPLDYGMRGIRFITWSPTNDQVTIMLDQQRIFTLPVP